jgi:hypothetical protein
MRTVLLSVAVVVAAALTILVGKAGAELRPDPPPGAKHATVLKHWHYTYDATWTASDGSKIKVRCRMGSHGFRCRILKIDWAPLETQPAFNFCTRGGGWGSPLRCKCDVWLIQGKLCKRWHIG